MSPDRSRWKLFARVAAIACVMVLAFASVPLPWPKPAEGPLEPFPPVPEDEADRRDLERFREYGTALQRDLANGRFTGGKLEDLLAAHPPNLLLLHAPYTTAVYGGWGNIYGGRGSTCVIARNGKLVRAMGPGCFYFTFFDALTDSEREEWSEGFYRRLRWHYGFPRPAPDDNTAPPPREVAKPMP